MPLACKIYELVRARVEDVIKALESSESVKSTRRSGTGFFGTFKLPDGSQVRVEIFIFRGRAFLIVLAGKRKAAKVAKLITHITGVSVIDAEVNPMHFLNLFSSSVVKVAVFDMIRRPGLRRIVLTGDAVSDTDLYREFAERSRARYILFQTSEGWVLGISDSGSLVFLSSIAEENILKTVKEMLLPLIVPLT